MPFLSFAGDKEIQMINLLPIVGIVLLLLCLLGFSRSYRFGGLIYIVLAIGVALLVFWLFIRFGKRRESESEAGREAGGEEG